MLRLLIAGIVALVGSVAATTLERTFMIPVNLQGYGTPYPPGILEKIDAAQALANQKNIGLVGGLIGALTCGLLVCASMSGTTRKVIISGVMGLAVGAVVGAIGGAVSASVFGYFVANSIDPFIDTVLGHACLVVAIGAGLGLTLRVCSGKSQSSQLPLLLILVAVLCSVLYPFVSAFVFPVMKSAQAVPEGIGNRTLWLGMPILIFAITIARSSSRAATETEASSIVAADAAE